MQRLTAKVFQAMPPTVSRKPRTSIALDVSADLLQCLYGHPPLETQSQELDWLLDSTPCLLSCATPPAPARQMFVLDDSKFQKLPECPVAVETGQKWLRRPTGPSPWQHGSSLAEAGRSLVPAKDGGALGIAGRPQFDVVAGRRPGAVDRAAPAGSLQRRPGSSGVDHDEFAEDRCGHAAERCGGWALRPAGGLSFVRNQPCAMCHSPVTHRSQPALCRNRLRPASDLGRLSSF